MEKKYYALYRRIKEKILSGEYPSGEKLPSKRVIADRAGVSLVTVETAYGMLEDEGYISSRERRGYFVNRIDAFVAGAGSSPTSLTYLEEEETVPAAEFEYSVWFKTVRRVIAEQGDRLFVKAPNQGCAVLRNAIADYLYRYRGMVAEPRCIVIGSGSEQLYETVVKLLGRDRIFGVEDPCYEQIRTVYTDMGVSVCPLRMGEDGIESGELQAKRFDVLHVTPFHSYPSGVTADVSKRHEYLRWAEEKGRYIVEDDFDSEFFMRGNPIESLYALGGGRSVIYINTFSKSLSPAMRIGYMILPEELLSTYDAHVGMFSCSVPVMDQYVLAEFIASGSFERHLNRMRRRMRREKEGR